MKTFFTFLAIAVGATAAVTDLPQPLLSLSANHATVVELPKGWPLFVSGTLFHSERLNKSATVPLLTIDPPNGASWADAVQLVVTAADGSQKAWNFKPAGQAEDRVLKLSQRAFVTFGWTLSTAETASIPTGDYRLAARLALQGTAGWNGEASSPFLRIKVIDQSTTLDEATAAGKALLNARYDLTAGNILGAASVMEQFLALYPSNSRALLMQSRILEMQGQPVPAWVAAQKALAAAYEKEPFPKEPPFSLILRERELANSFTGPRLAASWINGILRLTLTGSHGSSYKIERSTTLVDWTRALTVTITDSNSLVTFPAPTTNGEVYRFYRAVWSP